MKKSSASQAVSPSSPPASASQLEGVLVGAPNQTIISQNLVTRRTKCLINFTLEDFSRIHAQFANKNRPSCVETPVYSFYENDRIKFQIKLFPSKHSMNLDALYVGSDPSAQLFIDVFLVETSGRRFNFEYGRKVECQLNFENTENNGHFVYDRDDLEKKRDKLFVGDKLIIGIEVNATWIDCTEGNSIASEN